MVLTDGQRRKWLGTERQRVRSGREMKSLLGEFGRSKPSDLNTSMDTVL